MLSRIICYFKGHLRGKRISPMEQEGFAEFRCGRCGATWTRPAKAKAAA